MSDKPEADATDITYLDSRNEVVKRAVAASLRVSHGNIAGSHELGTLNIHFPNGRDNRIVPIEEGQADQLLLIPFERIRYLGDYQAIVDFETKTIEAAVDIFTLGSLRYEQRFYKLPGVTLHEQNGDVIEHPLSGQKIYGWALELHEPDAPVKIKLSTASPTAKALRLDPYFKRTVTIQIFYTDDSNHDDALNMLERYSSALFFELDLRFDLPLSLARAAKITPRPRRPIKTGSDFSPVRLPRQNYSSDALALYTYGRNARDTPLLQYLAYYQVIEYFFPSFHNAHIMRRIRNELKDPRFDAEQDGQVQRIISIASLGGQSRVNERDQLRATLDGSISDADIQEFLTKEPDVAQAISAKTGLKNVPPVKTQLGDLAAQLAERIYAIRCRIVHTKESGSTPGSDVLLPFSAEAANLGPDLMILRYVCQKVIVCGSRGRLW